MKRVSQWMLIAGAMGMLVALVLVFAYGLVLLLRI